MKQHLKINRHSVSSSDNRNKVAELQAGFKGQLKFYRLCGLLAAIALFKLVSYRSSEPWIFGLYSLPYFVFLVLSIGGTLFLGVLFYRFQLKAFYILIGSAVLLVISIAAVELGGQIYAFLYPSYRVLSFVPDRMVGWTLVPNLHFTWAGHYWYAKEYSVPIQTNSQGFRDVERTIAKPQGVVRVALLGDSMVEALQVPFDKTAGHVLEQRLNARGQSGPGRAAKYEVLNFGVSNYGVGQYLLAWEQYAAKFAPDYVFIFIAEIHMNRTVTKYESSAVSAKAKPLWLRPTYRLEQGELIREPARDFDEFINAQKELINDEFGGTRMVKRSHGLFIDPFLDISPWHTLMHIQRRFTGQLSSTEAQAQVTAFQPVDQATIDVNLRVIEELGREVKKSGSQLVVVDASRYFRYLKWEPLTTILERFSAEKGFGWIPLGDELLTAEKKGTSTRWPYDQHFNETGNEMFAEAMYRWMVDRSGSD